jgi:hypothetical protein
MRFRERYSLSCAGWKANNDEEEPERAGISNSALGGAKGSDVLGGMGR